MAHAGRSNAGTTRVQAQPNAQCHASSSNHQRKASNTIVGRLLQPPTCHQLRLDLRPKTGAQPEVIRPI